jgi:hypothetical protein
LSLLVAAVNCGLFLAFTAWMMNAATKVVPRHVTAIEGPETKRATAPTALNYPSLRSG